MAVTPHEVMTERMREIVEKARRVSAVIEAARKAALELKGKRAEEEEATPQGGEE